MPQPKPENILSNPGAAHTDTRSYNDGSTR